ncbi:M23 family metallopeptidase [Alteromonas sp. CYL-A6]|uniref:M23 family metallopeptidase n=1 Tax=Alteromonas nitratireducens TaxID=3390813 RepID=UPI0034C18918
MMMRIAGLWLTTLCLSLLASPLVDAAQSSGCFDDNRFCIHIKEEGQQALVTATRSQPLPVILTLYSALLPGHHASAFLDDDTPHTLGTLTTSAGFWENMSVRWTVGNPNARHDDTVRYQPALVPPDKYPVVQGFNGSYSHQGASRYALDFAAPVGTPVLAARGGIVIDTKQDSQRGGPSKRFASDANYVAVLHDDGTTGEYYHLNYQGVVVKRGEKVVTGQLLGYTGNTGFSSLPHLHFGVYMAKPHGQYVTVPFVLSSDITQTQPTRR